MGERGVSSHATISTSSSPGHSVRSEESRHVPFGACDALHAEVRRLEDLIARRRGTARALERHHFVPPAHLHQQPGHRGWFCRRARFHQPVTPEGHLDDFGEQRLVVRDPGDGRWRSQHGHSSPGFGGELAGEIPHLLNPHVRMNQHPAGGAGRIHKLGERLPVRGGTRHGQRAAHRLGEHETWGDEGAGGWRSSLRSPGFVA